MVTAQTRAGQTVPLGLAYLRKGDTFAELAAGDGVGTATACWDGGSRPMRD
jgi:hypothetical protein